VDWSAAKSATVRIVTVLQTIGVYALIPLAVYSVLALFTLWSKISRGPRYRPGQDWSYEPVWWTGNPDGVGQPTTPTADNRAAAGSTACGGARGSW
jgi:hypothetical protein